MQTIKAIAVCFALISVSSQTADGQNTSQASIGTTEVESTVLTNKTSGRSSTAFLALPESPPDAPAGGPPKRALLVGISKYSRGRGSPLDWSDLPTQDDVEVMRQVLIRKFGFKDADIKVLVDGHATKAAIEGCFRTHLIGPAKPGDICVFYFSGHGQQVPDSSAWGGTRAALVTTDYIDQDARNGYATHFRSDHLRELLRELKGRMAGADGKVVGNITVFLDACHSGGGTKNEMIAKGRSWDEAIDGPLPQPGRNKGVMPLSSGGYLDRDQALAEGYTFVAACRSDQPALCPAPGTKVSLLTYHLAEGMAKAGPDTTCRDLYEAASAAVSRYQIPQLEGEAQNRLLNGTAMPLERYHSVQEVDKGVVTIPFGYVQGATKGSRFAIYRAGSSVRNTANQLAVAEVVRIFTTACHVKLTPEYVDKVKDADLKAARAVEVYHNYTEQNLRVWVDGVTLPKGWSEKDDYIAADDINKDNYDVVARRLASMVDGKPELVLEAGEPILVLERRDGTLLARYPLTKHKEAGQLAELIRDRLLGEWRWVFLTRHLKSESQSGDRVHVKIRVVPLEVELDDDGVPRRIMGERKDFSEGESVTRLQTGDFVTVDVWNLSQQSVFVSVLDLGPKGSITPLFPPKGAGNLTEYAPAQIPAGVKQWQRIPHFAIRLKSPPGKEMFKVIATLEAADFRNLLYTPPELSGKGPEGLLPKGSQGLGQLLNHARRGTKDGESIVFGPDWASSEAVFELVEAPSNKK